MSLPSSRWGLGRLLSVTDGSLDKGFDGDGKVIVSEVEGKAQAVALRGDKIVVAGYAYNGTDDDFASHAPTHSSTRYFTIK